jgi:hypothetical protein
MAPPAALPRLVLVTRPTWLEELLERHGTLGQAKFYLDSRGQSIENLTEAHEQFHSSLRQVRQALPPEQRRAEVTRSALDRFLFAPDDVVVVIGQDGLVPNTAKYLRGQLAIGINPDPKRFEGVLCPHSPEVVPELLDWLRQPARSLRVEQRVMACARREDGQELLALNEVFVGHFSHQTARYRLQLGGREERQFSSGVICATGTGASGWARSIVLQRGITQVLPFPEDPCLSWFVREPWPSVYSGCELNFGLLNSGEAMSLTSEMAQGGVAFADGIEQDRLEFLEGQTLEITIAPHRLNLLMPPLPEIHQVKK